MTGPEHYDHADRILQFVNEQQDVSDTMAAQLIAQAQVHATLALAAATIDANQPDRITA